jgi:hypothetical protein
LTISGYAQGQRGAYIVQLQGPVQQAWKDKVAALGGEILGYIPEFAFKVRLNPAQAARVASLAEVTWIGVFQPAFKLSPDLALGGTNLYRVRIERGAQTGLVTAAMAQSGAAILRRDRNLLLVAADAAQVQAIAHVAEVAWVENYRPAQKHNEYGAGAILGASTAHANGYDGSTQTAAVADTGLGDGTEAGAHPDIPVNRITAIYNWPGSPSGCFQTITDDGPIDAESGHGTHTAVSVLGDGGASGEGKGAAPAARLVFQATENWATILNYCQVLGGWPPEGYFLTGLPDDLRDMYQQAYDAGARIHSNSWGAALAGEYTIDSANTDAFVWANPDMTITFSAGNEGTDANANGVVDSDSIGSPATAKNVLTIGASENDRQGNYQCDTNLTYTSHDAYQTGQTCQSMGGNQVNWLGTYGQRYPYDFPADPLASDVTAGDSQQMAAWSSRGPADDGRIKPDLVAPGTWILSGYSGLYQEGYGDPVSPQLGEHQWDGWGMPRNEFYKHMGGTSMANPIAAGAATVTRDYYQKAFGHAASAALVRATLINSAEDLLDENNDGVDDNDYPIPNNHEGWGRVHLAAATDGSAQYVEEANGLNTGGSTAYRFNVAASGQPFKVTLAWSDYPSTETAAQNLVNDLDLVVMAPDGTSYQGNQFSGGWSQTGGVADRANNLENVYVQAAPAGTWTVRVEGYNVPVGAQPYALVADGNLGQADLPPSVNIVSPDEGSIVSGQVTVQIEASDDQDPTGGLAVEWAVDSGTWMDANYNEISGYYVALWDTTATSDGGHTLNTRALDSGNNTGSDSHNVTVDNVASTAMHVASIDMSVVGVGRNNFYAEAVVKILDDGGSPVAGATVTGSFSGDSSGEGLVQSTNAAGLATFQSSAVKKGANWTFCVEDVSHAELRYDANANVETCDSTGTPPSPTPTPTPGPSDGFAHVGDLDGSAAPDRGPKWTATVTIVVHDENEGLVADATVTGAWSDGASGGAECTTDGSGQCSVSKANLRSSSATFSVTSIDHAALAYDPVANHEPDGDSNGTAITVSAP